MEGRVASEHGEGLRSKAGVLPGGPQASTPDLLVPPSPNLPPPSAPQVFERSSVSSLPPTPRRQPIPTLLAPQDLGPPGGSAQGPTWKVTGCPPPLTALSLPVPPHLPLLTSHANPLTRQSRPHVWPLPQPHPPGLTPALPQGQARNPSLPLRDSSSLVPGGALCLHFLTGLILSWVFCSNPQPEFRSDPEPGFCLGPRWELGSCSLHDFRSNSESDFVLSPCPVPAPDSSPLLLVPGGGSVSPPLESMPRTGGQEKGSLIASFYPMAPVVRELGVEAAYALPQLPVLSLSVGKFFLLSNFSPCCCPATLILSLFFLGNFGVDPLSAPPSQGIVLGEGDLGKAAWESLPLPSQVGAGGPLLWGEGGLLCTHTLTYLVWFSLWPPVGSTPSRT